MKNKLAFIGICFIFPSLHAQTKCEPEIYVVKEYGIDFGGMTKEIPAADKPEKLPSKGKKLYSIRINKDKNMVPDGFVFNLLLEEKGKKSWIVRRGGFASPPVVFGPIELPNEKSLIKGCQYEIVESTFIRKSYIENK